MGEMDDDVVRVVLDTSLFTNPDSYSPWGDSVANALAAFLETAERLRGRVVFYMPPSIWQELRHFLGEEVAPGPFEILVHVQAPNRYGVSVPGFLLYELIEEIRERINRGLRVAEKALREAHSRPTPESLTRLREDYRAALRAGILDSQEDVDLILLAYELDAALVSADQGVVSAAEKLGLRLIQPRSLKSTLEGISRRPADPPAGS